MTAMGNSGASYEFVNRIINGAMVIDQRNSGASVTPTTNGTYTLDRWRAGLTQSSKYSVQQTTTVPAGFIDSLRVTSTSSYAVTGSDIFTIAQYVEGLNMADLGWGAAGASSVTLSFWVRSSLTGTFGGVISNSSVTRSYPFTYTISSANTWTYVTVTIPGDTTGTWLTNNGIGMGLYFSLGTGSTYSGTAGAWAGAEYYSATGAQSVVGTNGATWYITGVQLEKGTTASAFTFRDYGHELILCQRYFENFSGVCIATSGIYKDYYFRTTKRAGPTIVNLYITSGTGLTFTAGNLDRCYQEALNSVPANFSAAASCEL